MLLDGVNAAPAAGSFVHVDANALLDRFDDWIHGALAAADVERTGNNLCGRLCRWWCELDVCGVAIQGLGHEGNEILPCRLLRITAKEGSPRTTFCRAASPGPLTAV